MKVCRASSDKASSPGAFRRKTGADVDSQVDIA
jgi:hypothetical protein